MKWALAIMSSIYVAATASRFLDFTEVRSGLTTTFTKEFFAQYKVAVIDLFKSHVDDFYIPDASPEWNLGIGKAIIDIHNLKVSSFNIDSQGSSILTSNDKPSVRINL